MISKSSSISASDLRAAVDDFVELPALIQESTKSLFDPDAVARELASQSVPLLRMRLLVSELKLYLDDLRIKSFESSGALSGQVLRWTELYRDALVQLHKMEYGDKSVTTNLHVKVSHGDIAKAVRRARVVNGVVSGSVVDVEEVK